MAKRSTRNGKIEINEDKEGTKVSKKNLNEDITEDLDELEESDLYDPDTKGAEGIKDKDGSLYDPETDPAKKNKKLRLLPEDDESILKKLGDTEEPSVEEAMTPIKEGLDKLFEGEDFSKEFKERVSSIFEAAVNRKYKLKIESVKSRALEIIKEQRESNKASIMAECDRLVKHFAGTWLEENRLAVMDGTMRDIAEGTIQSMKTMLSKFNVKVPRSRENLVEKLTVRSAELAKEVDELLSENIKLQESLDQVSKDNCVKDLTEGMSGTDADKFMLLAEEVAYSDEKSFRAKLTAIKEGLFTERKPKDSSDEFASKMVQVETKLGQDNAKPINERSTMAAYLPAKKKK